MGNFPCCTSARAYWRLSVENLASQQDIKIEEGGPFAAEPATQSQTPDRLSETHKAAPTSPATGITTTSSSLSPVPSGAHTPPTPSPQPSSKERSNEADEFVVQSLLCYKRNRCTVTKEYKVEWEPIWELRESLAHLEEQYFKGVKEVKDAGKDDDEDMVDQENI